MAGDTSLFARKLRAHRASSGDHGRMTQEQLADLLGVSVDAVSKYERSLSFVRGDLEHRLIENLGWSRDEVLACRSDWDARQSGARATGSYRVAAQSDVDALFDGSLERLVQRAMDVTVSIFSDLPCELAADPEIYTPIYTNNPDSWAVVLMDDEVVAKWSMLLLIDEDIQAFRDCRFVESSLTPDRVRQPLLPGMYFGYSPAVVVAPGHSAAGMLLVSSFIEHLEKLAVRGVMFSGIGTVAVSPAGEQLCRELGMERLGDFRPAPQFSVWELAGRNLAGSIFGRRSAILARKYSETFPAGSGFG